MTGVCLTLSREPVTLRDAERWGLNTVEVLNTNNRTTLGSVNNNKPNVGLGSPTLGRRQRRGTLARGKKSGLASSRNRIRTADFPPVIQALGQLSYRR